MKAVGTGGLAPWWPSPFRSQPVGSSERPAGLWCNRNTTGDRLRQGWTTPAGYSCLGVQPRGFSGGHGAIRSLVQRPAQRRCGWKTRPQTQSPSCTLRVLGSTARAQRTVRARNAARLFEFARPLRRTRPAPAGDLEVCPGSWLNWSVRAAARDRGGLTAQRVGGKSLRSVVSRSRKIAGRRAGNAPAGAVRGGAVPDRADCGPRVRPIRALE